MSREIDERVVSMSFENAKFQTGVSTTMSSLDKLNAALKKVGIDNGLDKIEKSANKITFFGLGNAIDKIKGKFGRGFPEADQAFSEVEKGSGKVTFSPLTSAIDKIKGKFNFPEADTAFASVEKASGRVTFTGLQRALSNLGSQFGVLEGTASVALGNIVSQATMRGGAFAKAFSFGPITQGFQEYQTQLNAVQTILSNTKASGAGLKDVNRSLAELNHYADKTIYNFTEMAKNIGTFTAAGVDLDTATGSIKGIANLAALSGSNSQQASTAMYQLSQAISAGRVSLQDWNSVVNAGMGGTVFQRALAQTAEKMGTLEKGAVTLKGKMKNVSIEGKSFRESVMSKPGEESWLTSDVLTSTLKQLSGDMTDAQLKAEGFSDAQIKAIQQQAKMAVNAATQVKTLSGLLDTTKEAIGSGWAKTWQLVFGDFGEAKTLFTGLSNAIGGMVGASANARNSMLKDWKDLGGRAFLIQTLKDAFTNLMEILRPIKIAFRDIFPKRTAADLLQMTTNFRKLVDAFKIGPETAYNLRRTFAGFFAVLDIGKQILGGFWTVIKTVFGEIGKSSGGFLKFTGNLGDALVALDDWLKHGQILETFFKGLGHILSVPINLISKLGDKLSGIFGGVNSASGDDMANSLEKVTQAAGPLKDALLHIFGIWYNLSGLIYAAVAPAVKEVVNVFRDLGDVLSDAVSQDNFDNFIKVLQTSLIGGIFLAVKKGLGNGLDIGLKKPLEGLKGTLDTMTGSLKAMQTAIKAHAMVQIAAAIALLAASAVALSLVEPKKLAGALTAMAAGFGELLGTLAILSKMTGIGIFMPIVASAFILMAGAMVILTGAMTILSKLSWGELAKGLVGVGGGLFALTKSAQGLIKVGPSLVPVGIGLMAIAAALNIIAVAMKIFATMSWGEMAKGLAGVGASLVIISKATLKMPYGLASIGGGLILIGMGLVSIAGAVKVFALMDWATIGKGLIGIGAAVVILGKALTAAAFTKMLPIVGAGLILVGIGLTAVSGAVAVMGSLDIPTLAKGLGAIGVALWRFSIGLTAMDKALPGAAALLIAAGGLAIFVPTLAILGNMKLSTIAKGLLFMVASIGALGAIGIVAGPPLAILGLGIAAIGLGVMGVGKGVETLAKGVILLGENGAKGVGILIAAFTALIAVIPKVIINFVKGLVDIGAQIVKLLPEIVALGVKITIALIDGLIRALPKVAEFITKLIEAIVKLVSEKSGPLITAGFKLLTNFLQGIERNIGNITRTVGNIIIKFLSALTSRMPTLVTAGANALVKFLEGLTKNMGKVVAAAATTIAKFLTSLASHIPKIIAAGANLLVKFLGGIAKNIGKVIASAVDVIAKFVLGIANNLYKVLNAGVTLAAKFIAGVAKGALKLVGAAFDAVMVFVHGIADMLRQNGKRVVEAGVDVASALIEGVISGLASLPNLLIGAIGDLIKKAVASLLGDEMPKAMKQFYDQHPELLKGAKRAGYKLGRSTGDGLKDAGPEVVDEWGDEITNWGTHAFILALKKVHQNVQAQPKILTSLGHYVGKQFANGINGSTEEINTAFVNLNAKLKDEIGKTSTKIKTLEDAKKKLNNAENKDADAIKKNNDALDKQNAIYKALTATRDKLKDGLEYQRSELENLADQLSDTSETLAGARELLKQAKQTQQEAQKNFTEQYGALPGLADAVDQDGNAVDQLGKYRDALKAQAESIMDYKKTLDALRAMHLDDKTYRKLLEDGTVDQKFADQLLAGGQTAIDELNKMDTLVDSASRTLAAKAAKDLYHFGEFGVKAAQSAVNGFAKQESQLREAMEKIAENMVKALKNKLKIKSPSRVIAEVGKFSALGMAKGLNDSSKFVSDAASDIGDNVLTALQNSMSHISDVVASDMIVDPIITPVLDLTQIQKDTKKLAAMTASESYIQAASISAEQIALSNEDAGNVPGLVPIVKLEQNNYSPKALSATEIYRQTNNQLSQAKAALGK